MDLEQQLRAALVPCRPGAHVRAGAMARVSTTSVGRRPSARPIVFGAILMVAAAAAMLGIYLHDSRQVAAPTVVVRQIPSAATPDEPAIHAAAVTPVATDEALPGATEAVPVAPLSRVVLLRPLQVASNNPAVQAALHEYYTTIVDGLRAAPGLVVLQPGQMDEASEPRVDIRLTFVGSADDGSSGTGLAFNDKGELAFRTLNKPASRQPHLWQMEIGLEGRLTVGAYKLKSILVASGRLPSDCTGIAAHRSTMCSSPAILAGGVVDQLRMTILPADPQLRQMLEARVLDTAQSYGKRFGALELLSRNAGDKGLSPDLVHAALDLVAASPDPFSRARVLDMLRGHGQPAALRALIDMASREADTSLRVQALSELIADYKEDPGARTVLQSLAANDPVPLVHQIATRAVSGDAAWNDYVLTTVKDASLSPAERFAPLAYLVQTDQKADARKLLDGEVIAALVDVLPSLVDAPSSAGVSSAINLLALLPQADSPSTIDLLLACLDGARTPGSRGIIVGSLGRHGGDPRVRGVLEKIAADDSSPEIREQAVLALRSHDGESTPQEH